MPDKTERLTGIRIWPNCIGERGYAIKKASEQTKVILFRVRPRVAKVAGGLMKAKGRSFFSDHRKIKFVTIHFK